MTKIIISLDGGGIRGYFQALLLDALRIHYPKISLIVGVSAGALNGILFVQNTIKNADVFTLENSKKICDESCFDKLFGKIQFEPIYDGKGREEVIHKNTSVKRFGDLKIPTAIICYDVGRVYPRIFKSWEDVDDLTCEIAMASAFPVYFPAHKYKNKWYIDGGVAMNNPAMLGYALGKELFPNEKLKILSIGNGDRPDIDLSKKDLSKWGSIQWITGGIFSIFVNSASQYTDEVSNILLDKDYLRIEDDKIGEIDMDDTTEASRNKIYQAFNKIWLRDKDKIEAFINNE